MRVCRASRNRIGVDVVSERQTAQLPLTWLPGWIPRPRVLNVWPHRVRPDNYSITSARLKAADQYSLHSPRNRVSKAHAACIDGYTLAMTSSDALMRSIVNGIPVHEFGESVFTPAPDLAAARVAIVTTAGLRIGNATPWAPNDPSFEVLPAERRDLIVTHFSPNFDRAGFLADPNVIYPADRLQELADEGVIGSVASQHLSFMGVQLDRDIPGIRLDSGPAAAKLLREDGVDVVLLTPA